MVHVTLHIASNKIYKTSAHTDYTDVRDGVWNRLLLVQLADNLLEDELFGGECYVEVFG